MKNLYSLFFAILVFAMSNAMEERYQNQGRQGNQSNHLVGLTQEQLQQHRDNLALFGLREGYTTSELRERNDLLRYECVPPHIAHQRMLAYQELCINEGRYRENQHNPENFSNTQQLLETLNQSLARVPEGNNQDTSVDIPSHYDGFELNTTYVVGPVIETNQNTISETKDASGRPVLQSSIDINRKSTFTLRYEPFDRDHVIRRLKRITSTTIKTDTDNFSYSTDEEDTDQNNDYQTDDDDDQDQPMDV